LDFEGLANYVPNKGLSVADISLSKTVELYDYRIAMEAFMAAEDHTGFTQVDMQFHLKLAEVYGNAESVQTIRQLQNRLYQIALRVLRKDRARIKVSHEDHFRMFEAVHTGREADAIKQMEEHLEFGKRILVM
jgi:DNA-binding GntR family transcriptional regulator